MTKSKRTTKPKEPAYPRKEFECQEGETNEETYRNFAEFIASPEFTNCRALFAIEAPSGAGSKIDKPLMVKELRRQAAAIQQGDMKQAESMLINQALSLQTMYARLTEFAMSAERIPHLETYLKLALKAQAQSRCALETLSKIKNPPVVYAHQANFAQGHQQVNNGCEPPPHEQELKNPRNQLLEEDNGKWVDTRTQSQAGSDDPKMEAMETVDRAED